MRLPGIGYQYPSILAQSCPSSPSSSLLNHSFLPPLGLFCHPARKVEFNILIYQECHPGSRHDTHDTRYQASVEPTQSFLPPYPRHNAACTTAEALIRLIVLQTTADHLVWVRDCTSNELCAAGYDDGRLGAHRRGRAADTTATEPAAIVYTLERLVYGKLDGTVRDANQRDAEPPVEAHDALGAEDGARAGRHGRVRAVSAVVRRQHARLEHPHRVCQHRRGRAGEGAGDKVVTGGGADMLAAAVALCEEPLEAGLEEEKRRPACGVTDEVGRQAAV